MLELDTIKKSINIAEKLDEKELISIGQQVLTGYQIDENSRAEWSEVVEKAMAIAKQTVEQKDHPWPNASNVKYPLITRASIDYAARTMPEIIQNDRIVKAVIVGADANSDKWKRAERVSQFLSYQLMVDSPDWEDGTDKLLQILPILGTVFKKTYYSTLEKRVVSELCVPDRIVVNYGVQSLETARRITHILSLYKNDIIERQRSGLFLDISLDEFMPEEMNGDEDFPIELLEQHCWLDLDEDGYKEPYVVTAHKESGKIFRIVQRFDKITRNADKKIVSITPVHYFTDYHFIRSPDGGFYSVGFGSLLLPLNSAINTLINQLIDSGTMANMQGGFLGRGLRLKNGEFRFKMGEWKVLDTASGMDIKQQIFPLPVREPSSTLFSLLSLLMQVGQDLSSTNDAMMGKQPAQNVATGTLNQLVEQGTKVFTAINKRVYRSLKKEYDKIYKLTGKHIPNSVYQTVLDEQGVDIKKDFDMDTLDVYPIADPTLSSDNQRMSRIGIVQQLRTINPREADIMTLQSLHFDQSTIDRLLPPIDPNAPPPPEAQKIQAEIQKLQAEVAQISAQATLAAEKNAMEASSIQQANSESEARIQEAIMRGWKMQQDVLATRQKLEIVIAKLQNQSDKDAAQLKHQMIKDSAEIAVKADANRIKAQLEESKKEDGKDNEE